MILVQELRRIESTFPRGNHVATPTEQLRQQLSAKEEECREKDEVIRENSKAMRLNDEALKEKDVIVNKIQQQLTAKDAECREQRATIRSQQAEIQWLRDQQVLPQKVS